VVSSGLSKSIEGSAIPHSPDQDLIRDLLLTCLYEYWGELPNKLLEQEVPMTELQRTIVRREKPQATDTFAVRLILKYLGPPSGNALDDLEADYDVIYLPSEGEPIVLEAFRPNIPDALECMRLYVDMSELRWQRLWFEQKRAAENDEFPEHYRCLARTRKRGYERLITDRYGWDKKPS
jgi:hypothetical protein